MNHARPKETGLSRGLRAVRMTSTTSVARNRKPINTAELIE